MKTSTINKKVRATELLLVTKGGKTAIMAIRRWFKNIRASYVTGKTGVKIPIDRSANRQNEINEAQVIEAQEMLEKKLKEKEKRKRTIPMAFNENELRNIANENLENELRELMSGILVTDSDDRA